MRDITRAIVVSPAMATLALSCPLCHTDTGQQVRAGIFGPDFAFNLVITVIPFILFLGITALIYFGIPSMGDNSRHTNATATRSSVYSEGEI